MNVEEAFLIPGWCWPRELGAIEHLVKNNQSMCHVEIGSFCGKSLYAACTGIKPSATVFAVDPCRDSSHIHCKDESHIHTPSNEWVKATLTSTITAIKSKRPSLDITHLEYSSLAASLIIKDNNLSPDSIYIDGDHNYAEVCADILTWYKLLKPGGLLMGHDFWAANPGVIDAVQELLVGSFKVVENTRIWYTFKPLLSEPNLIPQPLLDIVASDYHL
jgi:hypothetical protein